MLSTLVVGGNNQRRRSMMDKADIKRREFCPVGEYMKMGYGLPSGEDGVILISPPWLPNRGGESDAND